MADVLGADLDRAWARSPRLHAPLPHRCVPVAEFGGVRWIDDSKATNVGACRAALEGVGRRRAPAGAPGRWPRQGSGLQGTARRGGRGRPRARALRRGWTRRSRRCGRCSAPHVRGRHACRGTRAVDTARAGDTVLLAPACASFDQYASFGARGDAFIDAVRDLAEVADECRCAMTAAAARGPKEGVDGVLLADGWCCPGRGIVAVSSASMELAASRFGDPWHHLIRHGYTWSSRCAPSRSCSRFRRPLAAPWAASLPRHHRAAAPGARARARTK